ncbi:unnamed protein product [Mytilus coruscus]|uniref:Novel STAND NTPase 3 domain-containing protein n=1 Tax=Mytilus coruscus TaxID=42192 RepID=A0A6J8BS28_MYTCO|nr:unnamed protein product [Mytilus coruscus]
MENRKTSLSIGENKITTISKEEENYVRISLLLSGISQRAVRVLFDSEFHPSCLNASIKKKPNKLNDLKQKKIINQSQWDLLFSRKAVCRLGDQSMLDNCKELRTTIMDHSTVPKSSNQLNIGSMERDEFQICWNQASQYVFKCIQIHSCVSITASSGVGKTVTLRHVALQMADDGYNVLLVTNPCDIVKFNNPNKKHYKQSIAELNLKAKTSYIIKDCIYDCFPLICKLYSVNPQLNITDFFQNPFSVYELEIDKLHQNGHFGKYCALALCVMFNNRLEEEWLTDETDKEIKIKKYT